MKTVLKVLTALAAVAGVVYVIATYGDKIVNWCKDLLASFACEEPVEEPIADEAEFAEEAVEEVPAEEPAAEEAVEEAPAEEPVVEEAVEAAPVADEEDFAG